MKIIAQVGIALRLKREESHDNKNNLEIDYGRRMAGKMRIRSQSEKITLYFSLMPQHNRYIREVLRLIKHFLHHQGFPAF